LAGRTSPRFGRNGALGGAAADRKESLATVRAQHSRPRGWSAFAGSGSHGMRPEERCEGDGKAAQSSFPKGPPGGGGFYADARVAPLDPCARERQVLLLSAPDPQAGTLPG